VGAHDSQSRPKSIPIRLAGLRPGQTCLKFRQSLLSSPVTHTGLALERILPLFILGIAIVAVPVMVFSPSGLQRLESLRAERERVDDQVSTLTEEIRQLRAEVQRIKHDPTAVEQVARDELGLVRQTEVVFQFKQ